MRTDVTRDRRLFDVLLNLRRSYVPHRVLMLMCLDNDFRDREAAADGWRALAPGVIAGTLRASHYEVFDPEHLPELTSQLDAFLGVRA